MTIYYFQDREQALWEAKKAGRLPNHLFGSSVFPGGAKGFRIYEGGTEIFQIRVSRGKE